MTRYVPRVGDMVPSEQQTLGTYYLAADVDAALVQVTQERDQWKQGHNDAVRVGLEYQRQLAEVTKECRKVGHETVNELADSFCELVNERTDLREQLATVTEQKNTAYCEVEIQLRKLANMTKERDEQCAGKIAFYNGMNDMREQRTALERQLAKVTSEKEHA